MAQIVEDSELQSMISEMFFEQHFTDSTVVCDSCLAQPDTLAAFVANT